MGCVRYADDFVCAFQYQQDAELFYQQLNERLGKFGLEVSLEKTRILLFSLRMLKQSETFDFLGFEFRREISRNFKPIIRRRTSRKKLSVRNYKCQRLTAGKTVSNFSRTDIVSITQQSAGIIQTL
jgi:hypothetical protein